MYSSLRLSLVLIISALICINLAQHDETLNPGAKGSGVVEAVTSRLEASCVFSEDKLFTRRLAYVESLDGNHPDAYRSGYNGGIWKVDEEKFDLTQTLTVLNYLSETIEALKQAFGIDWATVKWADLRKPLYSAIGARLCILYNARSVTSGIPRSIADQANYWILYYRAGESKDRFISEAEKLEKGCSNSYGADIVFVLDESGSIGLENFLKVKSFVMDFVKSFNVGLGSHQTRIAVTTFSSGISRKFDLDDYTNQTSLINAIDKLGYNAGGTNTHLALDDLAVSFTAARGARSREAGHPRVGIVVTDGESNLPLLTVPAAMAVHAADITVFSVGVGSSLNLNELRTIASSPICLHLMLLSNFLEFDGLKQAIEKRTCDAPIVLGPGDNSIEIALQIGGQNFKIKVPEEGSTVKIISRGGIINFYVASTTYASSNFYEYRAVAKPGRLGVIHLTNPGTNGSVNRAKRMAPERNDTMGTYFCHMESENSSGSASIAVLLGDQDKCRGKTCGYGEECVQTDTAAWCESGSSSSAVSTMIQSSTLIAVVLISLVAHLI